MLDPAFDLHVTHDFGSSSKINTGFFALKTSSTWSFMFLEQVWAHNDFGQGQSDQASINHVINLMTPEDRQKHIKVGRSIGRSVSRSVDLCTADM